MEWIRKYYHVPAKRGAKIRFTDSNGAVWTGRITSALSGYIRVQFEGWKRRALLHPGWNVEYL